jgi:hypothetical protein
MKIIRTSQLIEVLTIPSLCDIVEPTFYKQPAVLLPIWQRSMFGKYTPKMQRIETPVFSQYKTDDFTIQIGAFDDQTIFGAGIQVTNKGNGLGTKLINQILDYCDDNGYEFHQTPLPGKFDSSNQIYQLDKSRFVRDMKRIFLDFKRLEKYYESFGFEWCNDLGFSTMVYNKLK